MASRSLRSTSKGKTTPVPETHVSPAKPTKKVKAIDYSHYSDMANLLRIDSIESTNVTGTGHPTSCASIADIFSILFFHEVGVHFHPGQPAHFLNDRILLSKGHACPILYAAFARTGVITREQLMSLRLNNSIIEGHPVPKIPYVDVATGSLGQGLSNCCGMAYSSKYIDKIDNRVFCVMGDGEIAEGSVWEAANFASHYKLNNLIGIVDVNRLGQSEATMFQHDLSSYHSKWTAFGWNAITIDGHNFDEIVKALTEARASKDKPTVILAKTFKGRGLGEKIENQLDWHGKACGKEAESIIAHIKTQIKSQKHEDMKPVEPTGNEPEHKVVPVTVKCDYAEGAKISSRKAYGNGLLKAYESNHDVVGLDGDTKNSTFSITLKSKHPEAFVECFIAEQNMVGVGIGLSRRNKIPFCSTFGAFFSRAADQIRIAGVSHSNVKLVGSHAGCSIGEDGPSQMALEDLAFFRTIPQALVLYPSDGVSAQKSVELAANYKGLVYVRTSRPDLPVLYPNDELFEAGKSKILRKGENDKILIIGGGVTVHEALAAHTALKAEDIQTRVLDIFSVKPVDTEGILKNAAESGNTILTVQDHYPEGGLFELVCSAVNGKGVTVHRLSVQRVPGSAKPEEQLSEHHIDRHAIVKKVKGILGV